MAAPLACEWKVCWARKKLSTMLWLAPMPLTFSYIFTEVYDTSKDFSWAMFGFNAMVLSFFPAADKTNMSICVGTLM